MTINNININIISSSFEERDKPISETPCYVQLCIKSENGQSQSDYRSEVANFKKM